VQLLEHTPVVESESDEHLGTARLGEVDSIQPVESSHPNFHLVVSTHIAHTNLQ